MPSWTLTSQIFVAEGRPSLFRHIFTNSLLPNGAAPKDIQGLLEHLDISTTMNIYAHSEREATGLPFSASFCYNVC